MLHASARLLALQLLLMARCFMLLSQQNMRATEYVLTVLGGP